MKHPEVMATNYERIMYERRAADGSVLWLSLCNPIHRNAMDDRMQRELLNLLSAVRADDSVRCVVVRGEGSVFCSGGDITAFNDMNPLKGHDYSVHRGETLQDLMTSLGKPVIAAVDGWCLAGGSELALMCDFAYATQAAKFGVTEIRIGLLPGWGGLTRLPQAVGIRRAREMLYRGEIIDSNEALRIGLVNRLLATAEDMYAEVERVAVEIAEKSQPAIRAAREVTALTARSDPGAAMAIERGALVHLLSTPEVREGVSAFLEKRAPLFNPTS